MEKKDKAFKIIAVLALVVAVVGLTVGFAAFSSTLKISSHTATVKAGDDNFSANFGFTGTPSCTPSGSTEITGDTDGYTAGTVTRTTWSGLSATLYKPGDKLTCTATISNDSDYTAFLNSISTAAGLSCAGDANNLSAVCGALKATVTVSPSTLDITSAAATTNEITGNSIAVDATTTATFVLEYDAAGQVADEDFTVTIPEISLAYATAD